MKDDFTTTYELYQDAIFRFCCWKCNDRELAKDLVQETFLRFYFCLQRKDEILNPRAFLYRIAHNIFIDHVRKKKESSLDQLLELGFEPSVDPWQHTVNRLDSEHIFLKLNTMRTSHKHVLQSRFVHGLTPADIARKTGETANAVSVRIYRGLAQLKALAQYAA
jgi:RNA polymerase sigma-70 factor (ECF subfamily)